MALIDLLPDAIEKMEESDLDFKDLPYLMAIAGYVLIFTLEKILFDSHSLMEHSHSHSNSQSTPIRFESQGSAPETQPSQSDYFIQAAINPKKSFTIIVKENESPEIQSESTETLIPNGEHGHSKTGKTGITPYLLSIALSVHSV